MHETTCPPLSPPAVQQLKAAGVEEMQMPVIQAAIGAGVSWAAILELIREFGLPIVIAFLRKWLDSLTPSTPVPAPAPGPANPFAGG